MEKTRSKQRGSQEEFAGPFQPQFTSMASSTPARSRAGKGGGTKANMAGELSNLENGISPFSYDSDGVSVKDAIELSQKAYWNVSIYRMTIDMMTEFCNSKVHWRGGSVASRNFFKFWYNKIGGWKLGDQFFREWFRSGNIFLYKLSTVLDVPSVENSGSIPSGKQVPLRYVLLNPCDIKCDNASSFLDASYSKILNEYELARLQKPRTDADKELFLSLPPETQKEIKEKKGGKINLEAENLIAVFCKKQDYEPLAVPIFFPVLFDINLKLEFKKAEHVIARTIDYMILLITTGAKPDDGGVNQGVIDSLNNIFQTETVGRVLVADYTTKMEFVIPELSKILGPEKYKSVNEDITNGLLNIFFGEDKFANSMIKIKVFLERLKEARKAFMESFLLPEVQKISKDLGFRKPPTPEFEDVDLRDEIEYWKVYNRLAEIGYLTPEETFEAYESNKLPLKEDSIESQKEFKKLKDQGLYESPINKAKDAGEKGRPSGTKAPQTTKKVSPIGASRHFSMSKIQENIKSMSKLISDVEASYKSKFNISRMSKANKKKSYDLACSIIKNVKKESWSDSIEKIFDGTLVFDDDLIKIQAEIAEDHNLYDDLSLALLANSITDKPESFLETSD